MKRNLLKTLCVALIATFSAVAAWGEVTKYPLSINGYPVTSENCQHLENILGVSLPGDGSGKFQYDPNTNTLELRWVTIRANEDNSSISYQGSNELTMIVRDVNQLNSLVAFHGPATIEGDGLLKIKESDTHSGFVCFNNSKVRITGCKIKASGKVGISLWSKASLELDNAVIEAYGTEAAIDADGKLIWNPQTVYVPKDMQFSPDGYLTNAKGEVYNYLKFLDYNPNDVLLYEDFESGTMPEGWVAEDNDGDGYTWEPLTVTGFHGSKGVLGSLSWRYVDLDPTNFLMSPKIEGACRIRFHVCATHYRNFEEHYWLTYTTSDDVEDIQGWEDLKGSEWTITEGEKWFTKEFDLPEGTKYVGFTHGWCKGNDALLVDEVIFFNKKPHGAVAVTPADEKEATVVGYYTIDGRRHNRPQSGVNIVKMSNGKAKKVLFP